MSLDSVKAFMFKHAPDLTVIELDTSTATVALAAEAHQVTPGQIAKTLAFKIGDREVLIVAAGDARVDNRKMRDTFGGKARMLDAERVLAVTGHPVGGVCPFGLATAIPVYCDQSLQRYDEVLPAAGALHSAVRLSPDRLIELTQATWIDVCQ